MFSGKDSWRLKTTTEYWDITSSALAFTRGKQTQTTPWITGHSLSQHNLLCSRLGPTECILSNYRGVSLGRARQLALRLKVRSKNAGTAASLCWEHSACLRQDSPWGQGSSKLHPRPQTQVHYILSICTHFGQHYVKAILAHIQGNRR